MTEGQINYTALQLGGFSPEVLPVVRSAQH